MKMKLASCLLVSAACLCSATNIAAKSTSIDDGYYTTKDAEYYLTPEQILFIRPGLELEILDVKIPADLHTEVTFMITDPEGLPLDRNGVYTPGPVSTSFILANIPEGEEAYYSYTQRIQTSPITGESAEQGTSDSGGTYTQIDIGTYMYKFGTAVPADYDMDVTHTVGIYARRDLREFDLDRYVTNELEHWVPSGMYDAMPRSIVTTETCNGRCHDPLAIHGGSRQEVGLCILCHNPFQDIDPDTGNSVDMPLMVHKIHMGVGLTEDYTIIGYRQSAHNYNHVVYPAEITECESCHTGGVPTKNFPMVANPPAALVCDGTGVGMTTLTWEYTGNVNILVGDKPSNQGNLFASGGPTGSVETGKWVSDGTWFNLVDAASGELIQSLPVDGTVLGCVGNAPGTPRGMPGMQHTNWMDNPSRKTCGSCHDYIDWEAGEGHFPQTSDAACDKCHAPYTGDEYDASVVGAHTTLYASSQFPGVSVEILDVIDTGPGEYPTVAFSLASRHRGLNPAELNRLRFSISGPNDDFDFYAVETVGSKAVYKSGNNWLYTFETMIPADAEGSYTVGVEGRNIIEIDFGDHTSDEEDQIENSVMAFAVTDTTAMPRRTIVEDAKCESCHVNLTLHGDNRKNANYCVTCHQADLTDAAVRPAEEMPAESVHQKYMIHKIHRGADLANGYVAYGYRGSMHDYSHVEYTGDLRNCDACHVNDSQQLPLPEGVLPTTTPREWWDPTGPQAATCLSCHDTDDAKAHAYTNTAFMDDMFGEACSTCHGEGKSASVDKVHAR